jgi:hypothetical protein
MAYRFSGMGSCETIQSLKTCCDSCAAGGSCGRGLSGCGCGGDCDKKGFGLFDSGFDFTSWSWPEWAVVGILSYSLLSFVGDTRRGVERVGRGAKRVKRSYQVLSGGRS